MNSEKNTHISTRTTYYDILRILATFAVMILHISAQHWHDTDVNSYAWKVFNVYDSCVRWAVPVFIMISGALFLSSERSVQQIYRKNILRIISAFIFWSIAYAAIGYTEGSGIISAIANALYGPGHMWFLFMITGLYIIVPFLTKYYLLLSLIFTFIIPQSISILGLFSTKLCSFANRIIGNISFHFTLGYVGYFVLGYYLSKIVISRRIEKVIYILGICGLLSTIVLSSMISTKLQTASEIFYDYLTLNVLVESIAVFIYFKNHNTPKIILTINSNFIRKMAKYSFGAYLVHVLIIDQLNKRIGLNTLSFNPAFSIPIIGIIVFVFSFIISALLNHIPFLKKYIV